MKNSTVKNTVVDEANSITYQVNANRILTDGEVYSAIRIALLLRGGKRRTKGETIEITWNK
ncbi:MAG: hypothetical protein H0X66_07265 [Verrucomicrobia bacterium]|nr:hypothetical protein [Verrucomicrobiota bacterium]